METQTYSKELPLDEYVRDFRDAPRFLALCRRCPRYGHGPACPPFPDGAVEAELSRYSRILIRAVRIAVPNPSALTYMQANALAAPVRRNIMAELAEQEKTLGGRILGFGSVADAAPVRPSLEAFGFDVGLTLSRLFGLQIQWSPDGVASPTALTYVAALLF